MADREYSDRTKIQLERRDPLARLEVDGVSLGFMIAADQQDRKKTIMMNRMRVGFLVFTSSESVKDDVIFKRLKK